VSEEVDLVVVQDHLRAEEICEALKQAGIHHVDFWPEHMLDFYGGKAIGLAYPGADHMGPYHIRVREEDLARTSPRRSSCCRAAGWPRAEHSDLPPAILLQRGMEP
jgi:hypothetical protein